MANSNSNYLIKIHEADPDVRDPWADDELNREPIANFLTELLSNVNTPFVLNLSSSWGTGKSFLLKRWRLHILNRYPCLFFNVWETDYSETPLIAFIAEMKEQLLKIASNNENSIKKINKLVKTSGRFLVKGTPLLAKGAARWFFGPNGPDEIKDLLQPETENDVLSCLGEYAEKAIDNHVATTGSIGDFKNL